MFRPRLGCAWTAQSCFVLTTDGLGLFGGPSVNRTPGWLDPRLTPIWDGATRELSGGGWPTKRYTGPAKNQITVLEAFQEEGWPRHIFDPLPRAKAPDRSRHLRDAVRLLNRHQIVPLIRFESDGMGEGIRWHWALPRRLPRRLVK